MSVIEKLEDELAKPGAIPRRSFIGRMIKLSAGLAGLAAGVASFPRQGYAHSGHCQPRSAVCCTLCFGDCNSNYYGTNQCPSGCGTAWTWTCSYNGCPWVCGECYDCHCSFAYPLCQSGCPC